MSGVSVILRTMNDPKAIEALGQICANTGVTMLCDLASMGLSRPDGQALWHDVVDRADYPARILQRHVNALPSGSTDWSDAAELLLQLAAGDTDKLRTAGLKLVLDGSIQGYTARLRRPGYINGAPNGLWYLPPETVVSVYEAALREGIHVHSHTNSDCNGN